MLFDPNPKSKREDLFGREKELEEFNESLHLNERLIIVSGPRRIGKTSFIRVALSESKYPYLIIDVREIHGVYGSVSKYSLYSKIAEFLTSQMRLSKKLSSIFLDFIKRIKIFKVSGISIEVIPAKRLPDVTVLLRSLDECSAENDTRFILAFDEAQYLRFSGGVRYDEIIAWSIDNLENITIVVTGSEVGVLKDFLRLENPESPLYGRYRREIVLERYTRDKSLEFLEKGFSELSLQVQRSELEEAVDLVDGIPGWLTLYGYYRGVRRLGHSEALTAVFSEGSKFIKDEVTRIIASSRGRYLGILEAIARGARTWKQIKVYLMYRTGPITDARFTELLTTLVKYGLVVKTNNEYKIADPVLEYLVNSGDL
ncbi:AAA family ATPase [Desulfurococcus amylolyticus]|uniref:ATPase n=1 Tax=Desulfurococcus amylolyticus DSM 16532 TaxID=768672 RepID=I3XPR4_DESAM|nr:ATP-binding protein [Desulfurococcus amylolyticus]AFL65938.1 ATPase [Desulfurococcus amylolyticus DSM 16532]